MDKIRVLSISASYPDRYNLWAPWNRNIGVTVSKLEGIELETVAPRPHSLPFSWFPHNHMCQLPLKEHCEEGEVHYPRFLYMMPKKYFYGISGEFYRQALYRYVVGNIKTANIVHARFAYMDGYGAIGICKKFGAPLVTDIHGEGIFSRFLKNRQINRKILSALDYSSKIICVSKRIYDQSRDLGIPEEKLIHIPLGVDTDNFRPQDKDRVREKLGIEKENIVFFAGRLEEKKGVADLLKAVSRLDKTTLRNTRVIMSGNGAQQYFADLARGLGIADRVTFTGPIFSPEELAAYYSAADIFVLPSYTEGRPIVVYEAMSSGCPVIATTVGGIPEQVEDGYNGFLINPGDVNALADRIRYLLGNESERTRMGENSRKKIFDEGWTWEMYAKRISRVYSDLVASG